MGKTKYYRKGHITVFLSLILTLILSVVCTTIESARLQGVRMQLQNITDMGVFSAFGEYNRELLELYDLFFLDMGYGTADGSMERVNARIKEFGEYNTDVNKNMETLSLLYKSDMWRSSVESVTSEKYVLATDDKGEAYYSQAVSYMKNKLGISLAESLLGQYDESVVKKQESFKSHKEEESGGESMIAGAKEKYQSEYDAALKDADGDESKVEMEKPSEASNPADTIKSIQSSPILELVLEDSSALSDKKISNFSEVASKRELEKGDGAFSGEEYNVLNKALFNEYLFEKFPDFLSGETESGKGIQYQAEYILCGKESDRQNLETVVNKLLLMREGINFVYLLTDTVKRQEALSLATLIVGYLGPVFVAILEMALLLAWAFAESVIELRMLMSGKKVALIKNAGNWNLSLSNLENLSELLDSGEEDEDGIDYRGYLKILIFFEADNKKIMRSLDLIERTIQLESPNFKIDNCTQSFTASMQYRTDSLFLRLPFQALERGSESYSHTVTRDFSYY
ncbi:DUF5702 domain-containing protein [Konateibacter massiliensis]|uniref:DUF5702 domain-containing protein n=1 Tax=Konateibacter massiliensis TaxID=2002841 RepID=UPI000C15AB10|nr:DUF5702 domain-containing protein [Konateibacter massiliensis]